MSDDPTDVTPFVKQIANDLVRELVDRAPSLTELSVRDQDAISTAILKAAWRGILQGLATYQHEFNLNAAQMTAGNPELTIQRAQVTVTTVGGVTEPDVWLRKYGDDA
ncbi:hypothetical protein [Conexibacter sp. S30A1]|uniref:hypothetical protein n=1 Tax=Conexibacter sp. S30A1 TaxID=2937800 RepID=UPI00201020AE|nr:hypothetical protein [Conexibacter sp. S30A1]